jgi:hypothetical protein
VKRGGEDCLAFDHAHDVAFLHDHKVFAIKLDFGAAPLAKEDAVAFLDVGGNDLAAVVTRAGADGNDHALGGLFLGSVGDDDAASRFLFAVDAPNDNAVVQGTKSHDSSIYF